jgi:hypothetical protein
MPKGKYGGKSKKTRRSIGISAVCVIVIEISIA